MPVDGKNAAKLLCARLQQCKTSPTVLFWLKLRRENLEATELGDMLLRLCDELDVVRSPNSEFFLYVKKKCAALAPISPHFFAVGRTKLYTVQIFREELRRRKISDGAGDPFMHLGACMPFCFQGLCEKEKHSEERAKSLFFIYSAPEDGMRMILEIFRNGKYLYEGKYYVLPQIYEHRLGNSFVHILRAKDSAPPPECKTNRLAYFMLDWEVERKKVGNRLADADIQALCAEFPTWFYKQMHAKKIVEHDAFVTGNIISILLCAFRALSHMLCACPAVVKNKSRPLDGGADYKHSVHVVFEIGGVPGTQLKRVCQEIFAPFRELLSKCKKDFSAVPDSTLPEAWWLGADLPTMGGFTGFALMYSRKSLLDPSPRLLHRVVFHRGEVYTPSPSSAVKNPKPFDPVDRPHDLASLSTAEALTLLYHGCCSVPKDYMARLSPAMEDLLKTQQSRTAARHHAALKGGGARTSPLVGGGGAGSSVLPAWMLSTVVDSSRGGYTENRDSAVTYFSQLMDMLDEEDKKKQWVAVHIGGGAAACPMCLSEDPPRMYSHKSNGVIVALVPSESPSVVYTRCTECYVASDTTNPHVERLLRSDEKPSCWMKLSKEGVKSLMEDMKEAGKGVCVCVSVGSVSTQSYIQ